MFSILKYFSAIGSLLLLLSCQSEVEEQISHPQETITTSSPLTDYLKRVAMVKTVQDNLIDNSNYCTIKFPYSVTVNNTNIAINSTADFQKVTDNINAYTNDNDIVNISFPVNMQYYNYIEQLIPTQADFNALINYWNKYPDLLAKINGLNINYPISINIYNSLDQVGSTVSIDSDYAFFSFIKKLNNSQFIALNYPISIVDYNNQTRSITSNLDFENAIKYAIDNCPENKIVPLDFVKTLTSGYWVIQYFFDDSEKTSFFNGYSFVFNSDYSLVASKAGLSQSGKWETKTQNGSTELMINFNADNLNKLNDNWTLFEFNGSHIRLRDVNNNTHYLYLERY